MECLVYCTYDKTIFYNDFVPPKCTRGRPKDSKNRKTNVGKKKNNCEEQRNDEQKEKQLKVKSAAEDEEKRRVTETPQLKNSR